MAHQPHKQLWTRVVRYFVAGVFAVLPLVITVLAVTWVISFLNGLVGPNTFLGELLSKIGLNFASDSRIAYAIGWLGVLGAIMMLGFLVESGMRRLFGQVTEAIIKPEGALSFRKKPPLQPARHPFSLIAAASPEYRGCAGEPLSMTRKVCRSQWNQTRSIRFAGNGPVPPDFETDHFSR